MATGEQYLRLAINFISIAAISRLLTPTEIGVSVIGTGVVLIALGLREFATSDCLIQRPEVSRADIRASFTVLFLLTLLITVAMYEVAPWFGTLYGEEKLSNFIRVAAFAGLIEAASMPIRGLLRRDMAFGALALINIASAAVTAVATIVLSLAGFSYMSVAWGTVVAAATTTGLSFWVRPDVTILRPVCRGWSSVLSFGGYNGASFAINRTYEALPQLVLGHLLPHSTVGLYNRAQMVSDIPDKIVLTSAFSVAFPALAAEVRGGRSLKEPYLRALGYITVLYWPALVLLALLADPVVSIVLGQQWVAAVPLLQLMAIAGLAWFPVMLTSPMLLAVGANRDRVIADLIGRSVAAVILCSAAWFGVMAMAASKLLTLPFQMGLSLHFVRRHVPFRWSELGAALWRSGVVTFGAALGPLCVLALTDQGFALPLPATAIAVALAVAGWLAGVLVLGHPILLELTRVIDELPELPFVRRLRERAGTHASRGRKQVAASGSQAGVRPSSRTPGGWSAPAADRAGSGVGVASLHPGDSSPARRCVPPAVFAGR
jgi:O-antigen/teichoic acid export membrane protein